MGSDSFNVFHDVFGIFENSTIYALQDVFSRFDAIFELAEVGGIDQSGTKMIGPNKRTGNEKFRYNGC